MIRTIMESVVFAAALVTLVGVLSFGFFLIEEENKPERVAVLSLHTESATRFIATFRTVEDCRAARDQIAAKKRAYYSCERVS